MLKPLPLSIKLQVDPKCSGKTVHLLWKQEKITFLGYEDKVIFKFIVNAFLLAEMNSTQ